MDKQQRLYLIKSLCAKDEGVFQDLTDDDIEEEIKLFTAKVSPAEADEFQQFFINTVFEGCQ